MSPVNSLMLTLAVVVAVAAAVRSTWSPCGLSMLSTLTPLAERSRGHRYAATSAWFVLGAAIGGATLGLVAAGLAVGVRALGPSAETVALVAAFAALVGGGSDLAPFGRRLPFHRRQVDELWLGRYRRWVYASGFGWQIGAGLVTYIMTAAVYLLVVLAALTATPAAALGVVTLFGLLRGLAVLLSARITTPAALHAFHRRFDAWGSASRRLVIVVQFGVAVIAGIAVGPAVGALVGLGVVVLVAVDLRTRPSDGWRARATRATAPASHSAEPVGPAWPPTSSAAASAAGPTPPPA